MSCLLCLIGCAFIVLFYLTVIVIMTVEWLKAMRALEAMRSHAYDPLTGEALGAAYLRETRHNPSRRKSLYR